MKKFYRILALLLALCLFCTAASAAGITEEEEHNHGIVEEETTEILSIVQENTEESEPASTEQSSEVAVSVTSAETVSQNTETPDRMTWTLDEYGTLWIGGKGIMKPITSADQQPWAKVRMQIETVRFCEDAHLAIDSIAYWFSGCVNLTSAELPSYVFSIGSEAFKGCTELEELLLYHSQDPEIAEDAFEGGAEMIVYVTGPEALNAVNAANWHGRSVTAFDLSEYLTSTYSVCGINGCTCSSCSWHYEYDQYDEDTHIKYEQCNNCSANEYAYGIRSAHTYNSSGVCTVCGYTQSVSCSHGATYTTWSGCNWYKYCNYCGELVSSGVSHGTYTYGDWAYYSSSQHRRYGTCNDCGGGGKYEYASHSTTAQYTQYSDAQHKVTQHCDTCNSDIGSATYESHTYTYGAWTSASATQHKRTKTCSLCGLSTEETGTHADSNSDGQCDTCGYAMTFPVTWDAGTNGGTVNGSGSVTTTVSNGSKATAPSYTPTKTGHTFTNWYTAATGGSLYSTVTITAARTFYAQFEADTYTITFDSGEGTISTAAKEVTYGDTYGELPLPVRSGYDFDGWFTAEEGGEQVTADTKVEITENQTLYAHWTRLVSFSVTVPAVLPLVMDEDGGIHTAAASIVNNSTGAVKVSSVSLTAQNGWTIAPYAMNAARQKVDSKQIGFRLQDADTVSTGSSESLTIPSAWQAAEGSFLSLTYDAVVTALSQPVTELNVLSVIFVLEWAEG